MPPKWTRKISRANPGSYFWNTNNIPGSYVPEPAGATWNELNAQKEWRKAQLRKVSEGLRVPRVTPRTWSTFFGYRSPAKVAPEPAEPAWTDPKPMGHIVSSSPLRQNNVNKVGTIVELLKMKEHDFDRYINILKMDAKTDAGELATPDQKRPFMRHILLLKKTFDRNIIFTVADNRLLGFSRKDILKDFSPSRIRDIQAVIDSLVGFARDENPELYIEEKYRIDEEEKGTDSAIVNASITARRDAAAAAAEAEQPGKALLADAMKRRRTMLNQKAKEAAKKNAPLRYAMKAAAAIEAEAEAEQARADEAEKRAKAAEDLHKRLIEADKLLLTQQARKGESQNALEALARIINARAANKAARNAATRKRNAATAGTGRNAADRLAEALPALPAAEEENSEAESVEEKMEAARAAVDAVRAAEAEFATAPQGEKSAAENKLKAARAVAAVALEAARAAAAAARKAAGSEISVGSLSTASSLRPRSSASSVASSSSSNESRSPLSVASPPRPIASRGFMSRSPGINWRKPKWTPEAMAAKEAPAVTSAAAAAAAAAAESREGARFLLEQQAKARLLKEALAGAAAVVESRVDPAQDAARVKARLPPGVGAERAARAYQKRHEKARQAKLEEDERLAIIFGRKKAKKGASKGGSRRKRRGNKRVTKRR